MNDYHINIFYSDDSGYIADIPDLGACSAFGDTPEKALAEIEIAKAARLKTAPQDGQAGSQTSLPTRHLPVPPLTVTKRRDPHD